MPRAARAAGARLRRVDAGQGGAEEAAGFRLPPGVDDDGLALADAFVVPAPDLGLDRLADRGHVLEVVVVLGGLVRADLAEHPDRGGRGVEDVHAELLGDPPRAAGVRVVRGALVEDAGGAEGERPVDDVGVAGDPADVRHAPVRVVRVDVLVELRRAGHVGEVAAGGVLAALRAAGGAGRVHQEQRVGRLQARPARRSRPCARPAGRRRRRRGPPPSASWPSTDRGSGGRRGPCRPAGLPSPPLRPPRPP